MTTLSEVKTRQPEWFSRSNKKFFNDVDYRILHSKKTGKPYLVRSTYAWSDMFGGSKGLHYRVNPLADDLTIMPLIDRIFLNIYAVKEWLKNN